MRYGSVGSRRYAHKKGNGKNVMLACDLDVTEIPFLIRYILITDVCSSQCCHVNRGSTSSCFRPQSLASPPCYIRHNYMIVIGSGHYEEGHFVFSHAFLGDICAKNC